MSLNVELLQRVKQHILAEPQRLRMNTWLAKKEPNTVLTLSDSDGYGEGSTIHFPSCGTVGCIAGWTVMLGLKEADLAIYLASNLNPVDNFASINLSADAERLLDINDDYMPFNLFFVTEWPAEQNQKYFQVNNLPEDQRQQARAEIVAEVIDLFIAGYDKKYETSGV